ncbi:hypothetical protein [Methylobacterium trifolii]|uniref:Uncharacterized protein n=1 Tax=Methylobacterium trifolii TaxID=1003092 RepID=A0ABQ4U0Z5_9HYPH|nr:hypothetical protein [Methylobacterium trifolii]GJE60552.1 hypothetical protein MPOCJGCO_2665 [Methylobacterium trifolii]
MTGNLRRTPAETKPFPVKRRRSATIERSAPVPEEPSIRHQVEAVLSRAQESGLTANKAGRISGRVSSELIERAKARTGLRSDTELLEFALANVAIADDFAHVFRDLKGTVDPDLDLGF